MKQLMMGIGLTLCTLLAPATFAQSEAAPQVQLKTDLGTMVVELYPEKAPKTVENFLKLVRDGFYNGLIFHRVIPGFVAQTGGYTFDFQRKPVETTVVNESASGLKNLQGTLAMARTSDPDSASSQFYINLSDNPNLDAKPEVPGYTVFGKVVEGFDVALKIAEEPRGQYRSFPDAPSVPVRILEASVVNSTNTAAKAGTPKPQTSGTATSK